MLAWTRARTHTHTQSNILWMSYLCLYGYLYINRKHEIFLSNRLKLFFNSTVLQYILDVSTQQFPHTTQLSRYRCSSLFGKSISHEGLFSKLDFLVRVRNLTTSLNSELFYISNQTVLQYSFNVYSFQIQ